MYFGIRGGRPCAMTQLLVQPMPHDELITGGDTPILYRPDRLSLIESGFFR